MAQFPTSDSRAAADAEARRVHDATQGVDELTPESLLWFGHCVDQSIDWEETLRWEEKRRNYLDGRTVVLEEISEYSQELGLRPGNVIKILEAKIDAAKRRDTGAEVLVEHDGKQFRIPINDAITTEAPQEVRDEIREYWQDLLRKNSS